MHKRYFIYGYEYSEICFSSCLEIKETSLVGDAGETQAEIRKRKKEN